MMAYCKFSEIIQIEGVLRENYGERDCLKRIKKQSPPGGGDCWEDIDK